MCLNDHGSFFNAGSPWGDLARTGTYEILKTSFINSQGHPAASLKVK